MNFEGQESLTGEEEEKQGEGEEDTKAQPMEQYGLFMKKVSNL